tara:strand:- start:3952 stop:4221 length:270 start_codon:yes stop_codon:yes gene_type:complete
LFITGWRLSSEYPQEADIRLVSRSRCIQQCSGPTYNLPFAHLARSKALIGEEVASMDDAHRWRYSRVGVAQPDRQIDLSDISSSGATAR